MLYQIISGILNAQCIRVLLICFECLSLSLSSSVCLPVCLSVCLSLHPFSSSILAEYVHKLKLISRYSLFLFSIPFVFPKVSKNLSRHSFKVSGEGGRSDCNTISNVLLIRDSSPSRRDPNSWKFK